MSKWMMYRRRGTAADSSIVSQYVGRVNALGGTVSAATNIALNTLVQSLLNADLWRFLTEVWPCCGSSLAAATVKLKVAPGTAGNYSSTNFVGGDYQETGSGAGLNGDGATKSLAGGPAGNTLGTSSHLCASALSYSAAGGNRSMIGVVESSDQAWLGSLAGTTTTDARLGATVTATLAAAPTAGIWCASRLSNIDLALYKNGASVATSSTTTAAPATTYGLDLFSYNNTGAANALYAGRLCFATVGLGLTAAQVQTLYLLISNFNAALTRS